MIKILLDASALKALHEIHPDATLELARNSAATLGREIAKTVASDTIKSFLRAEIDNIIKTKYSGIISTEARDLVAKEIKERVQAAFDMKTIPDLITQMRSNAQSILTTEYNSMEKGMSAKIDELIRHRFAAAFGTEK